MSTFVFVCFLMWNGVLWSIRFKKIMFYLRNMYAAVIADWQALYIIHFRIGIHYVIEVNNVVGDKIIIIVTAIEYTRRLLWLLPSVRHNTCIYSLHTKNHWNYISLLENLKQVFSAFWQTRRFQNYY